MKISTVNFTAEDAAQAFVRSLRETGFAVLTHHPIKEQCIQELYRQWDVFFASGSANKHNYLFNPNTQVGWAPPSVSEIAKGYDKRDLKEYFNFFPHGSCPDELRSLTLTVYQQLFSVAEVLLTWIQDNVPTTIREQFSEPLPSMITDSPEVLFRINYYPSQLGTEEAGALRAAAHADIDLITVLTAGNQSGLQAQTVKGEWVDIPCEHGNLVINAGDMLQECSGGYFPSTLHRVINPCENTRQHARMSCPLFVHPRPDVVLSERYTQASYLHERLVEMKYRPAIN